MARKAEEPTNRCLSPLRFLPASELFTSFSRVGTPHRGVYRGGEMGRRVSLEKL